MGNHQGTVAWAREAHELAEEQGEADVLFANLALARALGFDGDAQGKLELASHSLNSLRELRTAGNREGDALNLVAEAHLALGAAAEARSVAQGTIALLAERGAYIYIYGLSTYGTLARAQLALNDPVTDVERTLNEFAASIKLTGMIVFDRELSELRTALSEIAP